MTDLKRAEQLIEKAEAELEAVHAAHPGFADTEAFQNVFDMLRELARNTSSYGLSLH